MNCVNALTGAKIRPVYTVQLSASTDVKYLFIRDFIFENNLHAIQADCPQLF